jgi:lipoate synthase
LAEAENSFRRHLPGGAKASQERVSSHGLRGSLMPQPRGMLFSGHGHFLILGDRCTRNCRFCAVAKGPEGPPDAQEPQRVAEAVKAMSLKYVVITSVTRDDLPDGGAGLFAGQSGRARKSPGAIVEVLIPDFQGSDDSLKESCAPRRTS